MQNNAGLCGAIPDCLVDRVPELEGTGLMDPRNASANPEGGLCDESPPSCLPEHGCRWAELCCESALHAYSAVAATCQHRHSLQGMILPFNSVW